MPALSSFLRSLPRRVFAAGAVCLLLAAGPLGAQTAPASLRVGLVYGDPFVMDNNHLPVGYGIDLWQEIAALNEWTYKYSFYPTIRDGLDAVAAGQCDVLVSDTSITSDRLQKVDFSQPFFRSGFQIMVTNDRPHTLGWMIENLKKLLVLKVIWLTFLVVLVLSLVVAFFERRHNPNFPRAHHESFAEAFYYVVSLALTGRSVYKGFPGTAGKIATFVWMVMGMLMVAFITSTITSTMTIERLRGQINGPEDLPGRTIGVLAGSTAEIYAQNHQLTYLGFPDIKSAVTALVAGQIQGIVDDASELEYYDASHPELPITEVGPLFSPQNFGFVLAKGDPRRYQIDEALEILIERGKLIQLGKQYLGNAFVP